MKKRFNALLLGFVFFTFLPFVTAEITLSQPEGIYNIDDPFSINVGVSSNAPANDFLILELQCSNGNFEIYKNPLNLQTNQQTTVNVVALLSTSVVGDARGICNVVAKYEGQTASSQNFEITDIILVEATPERNKYDPSETISVKGSATKRSGSVINGIVEARIDSLGVHKTEEISGANFSISLQLPGSAESGEHDLKVSVYERNSQGIIGNNGNITELIRVNQILKDLQIKIDSQTILPGNEIKFSVDALDQSGKTINKDIEVVVYEPEDFVYSKKVLASGNEQSLILEINETPGYWKIEAVSGDVDAKKLFYLEEVTEIQKSLINDTLIVSNTGNTPYSGPIEILIGSAVEVKQIDLAPGQNQKFRLYAPTGTYLVRVKEGDNDTILGNVALTGNAISVEDVREGVVLSAKNPLFWVLGIVLLILIIIYVRIKVKGIPKIKFKNKEKSKVNMQSQMPIKATPQMVETKPENINLRKVKPSMDDSAGYGGKESAGVVAIKVQEIKDPYAIETINNAFELAEKTGAKIYVDEEYKVVLFSQSLTKISGNDSLAVKLASRMQEMFLEHNKRFKNKILFGIGVNSGEIISETRNREFHFTSVGNTITKAKRLAFSSNGEILLSDEIYRKISGEVKAEKGKYEGTWLLLSYSDRSKHSDFLKKFIKRN